MGNSDIFIFTFQNLINMYILHVYSKKENTIARIHIIKLIFVMLTFLKWLFYLIKMILIQNILQTYSS